MKKPEESNRIAEALRHVGRGLAQGDTNCSNCPMQEIPIGELECGSECPTTLMMLAADLIEQLEKKVPKWISVKERLPDSIYRFDDDTVETAEYIVLIEGAVIPTTVILTRHSGRNGQIAANVSEGYMGEVVCNAHTDCLRRITGRMH